MTTEMRSGESPAFGLPSFNFQLCHMSENNICRTTLVAALVANLQEAKCLLVMDSLGTKLLSIPNSITAPKLPACLPYTLLSHL